MWFERLTGFREESPEQVRSNLTVDGPVLESLVNGRTFRCGTLEVASLHELRARVRACQPDAAPGVRLSEVVADAQQLHTNTSNAGAMFQVASQFNLLEMVGPSVTPESGVGIYEHDRTQGPACAIAAGAGTIYRNYFARVGDQIGQTSSVQIDCLADIGKALGNRDGQLWTMTNGYALASQSGLMEINARLAEMGPDEFDQLRGELRVGIQWDTEVTLNRAGHTVSQVYCSALPVAYSRLHEDLWEPFARLVLDATFEASLCAAVLNQRNHARTPLFLTLVGGGAFGNMRAWIFDAIRRAVGKFTSHGLDIAIVSYGRSDPTVRSFIDAHS